MILERIFHFFMFFWPGSIDLRQVDLNGFLQQQIFIAFGADSCGQWKYIKKRKTGWKNAHDSL